LLPNWIVQIKRCVTFCISVCVFLCLFENFFQLPIFKKCYKENNYVFSFPNTKQIILRSERFGIGQLLTLPTPVCGLNRSSDVSGHIITAKEFRIRQFFNNGNNITCDLYIFREILFNNVLNRSVL
jgi:hypothetical protein